MPTPIKSSESARQGLLSDKAFLVLLVAVSLAFAWIVWPFFGAVLWATVLAILFSPLYRRLLRRMRQRRTLAALATVLIILVMVILPSALIGAMLLHEAFGVYDRVQSGELTFARYAQQVLGAQPDWVTSLLQRFGLNSVGAVQERVSSGFMKGLQLLASQALNVGQSALEFFVGLFIMLYLLFFLLRDGSKLSQQISSALPLPDALQRNLFAKFTTVIRATIKGSVVVAIVQGVLGGLMFWFLGINAAVLWAVVMAFLSLLPVVGTGIVWLPVAVYLLATGATWDGIVLIAYGVLVIGLVDNILRPILVGQDTQMPDYVVLISTLGGIAVFGLNGFVIGPVIAAMFIAVWSVVAASRPAVKG
jgi:predicted PurR-regulated permease PerM